VLDSKKVRELSGSFGIHCRRIGRVRIRIRDGWFKESFRVCIG